MNRPLVVDLDGTLIRSDLLHQSFFTYFKQNIFAFFEILFWLSGGKARLKAELARRVRINAALLPYNEEVILFLQSEKKRRPIILATASHRIYAEQVATHLDLFDRVFSTDDCTNLSAEAKRELLVREYGEKGFDYMGNSRDDLAVWRSASRAYLVDPSRGVEARASKLENIEQVIISDSRPATSLIHALRMHQWIKNLLIFIPLLSAHRFTEPALLASAFLAFLLFSLCSSSVYLVNDILDVEDDRCHPTKCSRPFASGKLSLKAGIITASLMLFIAVSGAIAFMPWKFTATLGIYYLLTLAYSLGMKRIMIADIFLLSLLYTLRIIGGAFACMIVPSFWILGFSMFLFLCLAIVKRYAELHKLRKHMIIGKTRGRGYFASDLEMLSSLGGASGYMSVMVLALYTQDARTMTMYSQPELIWLACPILLFWISHVWMITHRGQMHEDPVMYALKDPVSLVSGLVFATVFIVAI